MNLVSRACLLFALVLVGCAPAPRDEAASSAVDSTAAFARGIADAHGAAAWRAAPGFTAEIDMKFAKGGTAGRMTIRPDMSCTRFDLVGGDVLGFDGTNAWVMPPDSKFQGGRFHALTWPYFLLVPTKLQDPGARIELLGQRVLLDRTFDTARLTFDAGTGDSPDDWYVLYRDPASGRLEAMGYIVTFGASRAEAEKEPHAITYHDFVEVDGMWVPTRWQFWKWSEAGGITGEPIGVITLANPRSVATPDSLFIRPAGARIEPRPTG